MNCFIIIIFIISVVGKYLYVMKRFSLRNVQFIIVNPRARQTITCNIIIYGTRQCTELCKHGLSRGVIILNFYTRHMCCPNPCWSCARSSVLVAVCTPRDTTMLAAFQIFYLRRGGQRYFHVPSVLGFIGIFKTRETNRICDRLKLTTIMMVEQ